MSQNRKKVNSNKSEKTKKLNPVTLSKDESSSTPTEVEYLASMAEPTGKKKIMEEKKMDDVKKEEKEIVKDEDEEVTPEKIAEQDIRYASKAIINESVKIDTTMPNSDSIPAETFTPDYEWTLKWLFKDSLPASYYKLDMIMSSYRKEKVLFASPLVNLDYNDKIDYIIRETTEMIIPRFFDIFCIRHNISDKYVKEYFYAPNASTKHFDYSLDTVNLDEVKKIMMEDPLEGPPYNLALNTLRAVNARLNVANGVGVNQSGNVNGVEVIRKTYRIERFALHAAMSDPLTDFVNGALDPGLFIYQPSVLVNYLIGMRLGVAESISIPPNVGITTKSYCTVPPHLNLTAYIKELVNNQRSNVDLFYQQYVYMVSNFITLPVENDRNAEVTSTFKTLNYNLTTTETVSAMKNDIASANPSIILNKLIGYLMLPSYYKIVYNTPRGNIYDINTLSRVIAYLVMVPGPLKRLESVFWCKTYIFDTMVRKINNAQNPGVPSFQGVYYGRETLKHNVNASFTAPPNFQTTFSNTIFPNATLTRFFNFVFTLPVTGAVFTPGAFNGENFVGFEYAVVLEALMVLSKYNNVDSTGARMQTLRSTLDTFAAMSAYYLTYAQVINDLAVTMRNVTFDITQPVNAETTIYEIKMTDAALMSLLVPNTFSQLSKKGTIYNFIMWKDAVNLEIYLLGYFYQIIMQRLNTLGANNIGGFNSRRAVYINKILPEIHKRMTCTRFSKVLFSQAIKIMNFIPDAILNINDRMGIQDKIQAAVTYTNDVRSIFKTDYVNFGFGINYRRGYLTGGSVPLTSLVAPVQGVPAALKVYRLRDYGNLNGNMPSCRIVSDWPQFKIIANRLNTTDNIPDNYDDISARFVAGFKSGPLTITAPFRFPDDYRVLRNRDTHMIGIFTVDEVNSDRLIRVFAPSPTTLQSTSNINLIDFDSKDLLACSNAEINNIVVFTVDQNIGLT